MISNGVGCVYPSTGLAYDFISICLALIFFSRYIRCDARPSEEGNEEQARMKYKRDDVSREEFPSPKIVCVLLFCCTVFLPASNLLFLCALPVYVFNRQLSRKQATTNNQACSSAVILYGSEQRDATNFLFIWKAHSYEVRTKTCWCIVDEEL